METLFAWICEALEPVGSVTMRKMMGGATVYLDGTVFAIIDEDEIRFKSTRRALVLEVGAHQPGTCQLYLLTGWQSVQLSCDQVRI